MTSPLLTKREAATILKVSTRQIDRYVAERRLPCLYVGRYRRFRDADVLALTRVVEIGVSSDRLVSIVREWRAQHHQTQGQAQ